MKKLAALLSSMLILSFALPFAGCAKSGEKVVTLRVSSWEEYIDLGDWDEEEAIELDGLTICPENSMVDDFTEWFNSTHD